MRNATILIIRLNGTATETVKNIVLAGVGRILILDEKNVSQEDLGAGFFFRDEDVGKHVCTACCRVSSVADIYWAFFGCSFVAACRGRQTANPKFKSSRAGRRHYIIVAGGSRRAQGNTILRVRGPRVCHRLSTRLSGARRITVWESAHTAHTKRLFSQIQVNDICRQSGKSFYAGGTYGLLGYIFCDLLIHHYISP